MAGLIPVGGGGGESERPTCFRCGEPAAGPCALCRVMICTDESCSVVVRERGLPEVVLCVDCARRRPVLAASPIMAPVLALASAALTLVLVLTGAASMLAGVGYLIAAAMLILAVSTAIAHWQWRRQIARARGHSPGD